jgi:hypothetical protein
MSTDDGRDPVLAGDDGAVAEWSTGLGDDSGRYSEERRSS